MIDTQIIAFLIVLIEFIGLLFVPKKFVPLLTFITLLTIIVAFIIK